MANADRILAVFDQVDKLEAEAKRRVKQAKKVESLEEAERRILSLKLTESEATIVRLVFDLWRTGRMPKPEKRISKKGVFETWRTWLEIERERKKHKVLESKRDNCWIVTNEETLRKLEEALDKEDIISLDTETTGLDWFNDRIVGIAGYFPRLDVDFYIPYGHIAPQDKDTFVEHGIKYGFDAAIEEFRLPWLLPKDRVLDFYRKCVKKRTVWHNYDFDFHMSANESIIPNPPFWDTLVAQRILNDHEESYGLKELHAKYIGEDETITFEDLFDDGTIFDKDIVLAGIYAAGDARKTYNLMVFQKRFIDTVDNLKTVWYEIEQPLLQINPMTERNGVRVDLDYLAGLTEEFKPRLVEAERALKEAFGLPDDFNVNSPKQLAHLVYDIAGADPTFPRKFKKNDRSTAADVIDALCDDLPQLKPLLEYRQLAKLLGTYVEKIPKAIEPATGRMHFALNSVGTDTGRYSSSEYVSAKNSRTGDHAKGMNIQNIPSRTEDGVKVRMAFIPHDGWLFISSDLSQIEPRCIAHILYSKFGDPSMKDIYDAGVDLYTTMAMKVFNLDEQYCVDGAYDPTGTFKPRKLMKEGVLAYLYGQSEESFARRMGVSLDVARQFFQNMEAKFPGLKPMKRWILDGLMTRGKVAFSETLDGGKRRYPGYREAKRELMALEERCFRDGLDIYRNGGPRGRTEEEQREIAERVERVRKGNITESDREAIIRTGLYWRHKDKKDRFWELRRFVSDVERAAVNHVIQGSSAHALKRIIIRLFNVCQQRGWRFITSIHDEVWLEVPKEDVTEETLDIIEDCMTNTVKWTVPIKCDTVIQPRWMEEYRRHEWDFERGCPKDAVSSGA